MRGSRRVHIKVASASLMAGLFALMASPVSATTFGDIDCSDLTTAGILEAADTVDGNLTVSSGDCTVDGTVDGNIVNEGSGDVALNGSLNGNIELEGSGSSASGDGSINGNIVCSATDTTSSFSGDIDGNVECQVYVALGNSLAVGVGSSDPPNLGYVPLFQEDLTDLLGDPNLSLLNVGHGGDTSTTLITHGHLAAALDELARNGDNQSTNDVLAVSIDIGGNDIFGLLFICAGGLTPPCVAAVTATFGTFAFNFDFILSELRAAAGPDTPIVAMTYYNSLVNPGCPFSALAPLADVVLEGGSGLPVGLNDLIRSIAATHDVLVADLVPGGVFPALLGPADIQPDCLHANDDGYEIIADEFKDAFKDQ